METVKLNNGVEMPILGYGVYQVTPAECERCVTDAISVGYRSIDTAQAYYNEEGVGNAIIKSRIPRSEFFITTKVWVSNAGYERAAASIDESLRLLQTDYIDLLLIHQPYGDYYGTYHAMQEAYKAGKIRAIGVSNFYSNRFIDLVENVEIVPALNQMETHVFTQQVREQEIMAEYGTQLESWGPFVEGQNNFFANEVLAAIGEKYGKSVAQVALRYLIQRNVVVIPKSIRKERMAENMNVFDFSLTPEDMKQIASLDQQKPLLFSPHSPESAHYILNYSKNRG